MIAAYQLAAEHNARVIERENAKPNAYRHGFAMALDMARARLRLHRDMTGREVDIAAEKGDMERANLLWERKMGFQFSIEELDALQADILEALK